MNRLFNTIKNPMFGNFISLVTLQGINYLLPLLSFPFLVRMLHMEKWGLVSFGYAFMQYFVMFTDFGFNLSGTKYISENRDHPEKINRFLNSGILARICLGTISFLLLAGIIFSFDKFRSEAQFYILYFGIVIGNVMFPLWFFQGMEKMKFITLFNLIAKSISLIPLFIVVKGPSDYMFVPVCYSMGYILSGIVSIYFIYHKFEMKWFFTSIKEIKTALRDSSTYFLSRASLSAFANSNTFIIGLVCGDVATGIYATAEKLHQAYNQLIQPFTGVLFPHMAKTKNILFFKKVFKQVTLGNFLLVLTVFLLATPLVKIIFHPVELSIIVVVFRILLVSNLFSFPSMMLGYPYLAAMGHPKYTNWTVIFTSIFHIFALLILLITGKISIITVSIVLFCSELLLLLLRIRGVIKFQINFYR